MAEAMAAAAAASTAARTADVAAADEDWREQAACEAAAAGVLNAAAALPAEQHIPDLQPTPVKPLVAVAQLAQAAGAAADSTQELEQSQQQQQQVVAGFSHAASVGAGASAGAAGQLLDTAPGVMTRRQLRWAQQAAEVPARPPAGAAHHAATQPTAGQLRDRIVDL
jgi:hypothetical protein